MVEGEPGDQLYFIISGKTVILERKSKTLIDCLQAEQFFGEISFFSGFERACTVEAIEPTELLSLSKDSFFKVANSFPHAIATFNKIHNEIDKKNSIKPLNISCYICKHRNHIATNCRFFGKIKGNLTKKKRGEKVKNISFDENFSNAKEDESLFVLNESDLSSSFEVTDAEEDIVE